MDSTSQQKVCNAGFVIIRADDQPSPRIKQKFKGQNEWITREKFDTKAARDRRFKELMKLQMVIND